jgi:hypothetical protein
LSRRLSKLLAAWAFNVLDDCGMGALAEDAVGAFIGDANDACFGEKM